MMVTFGENIWDLFLRMRELFFENYFLRMKTQISQKVDILYLCIKPSICGGVDW